MDGDDELELIRQRRMQQLMSQYGGQGAGADPEAMQRKEEAQQAADEDRQRMLVSILEPGARERLARIALVKPDKARMVENAVIQMAQQGRLFEKVSEQKLIELLEQLNEQTAPKSKITIQRRRPAWDDE